MNIGIICEFNPFHSGHKYLINSVKGENDTVICCMSGNFVQRGEFAVLDKFQRTETALQNGADLVIELPAEQATLSAEGFAQSAVDLLESLGVTDTLAFGAENHNLDALKAVADTLKNKEIQKEIAAEMKKGISYPAARKNVIKSELLELPNNILAIEYLKAASLPCIAVKRIGKGHDTDDEKYSASAIRSTYSLDDICSLYNCEKAVLFKLRNMSRNELMKIDDVSEGLENRIYSAARQAESLDELYAMIKSKRYTLSRIKRIILRAYLGIEGCEKKARYIRILGFNDKGRKLLPSIKKHASKPIITKLSDCDEETLFYFEKECRYTDIYNLGYKKALPCGTEQRSQIVII